MNISRRLSRVVILACATQACAPPPATVAPVASRQRQAFATALDHYLAATIPADEPGLAVLVMKRGEIVFEHGYGLADLKARTPVTPQTLFNVGSISKTFVANAILILQDEHRLSVDDDLLKYFPEFKNPQLASQVKLRHLLTHTSGLPDAREVAKHPDLYLTARDPENWHPITQVDALDSAPGAQFKYSNPAFNGLALIVEHVSGVKWQEFVRTRIFLPSGMRTSTITDGPHPERGVAHAYVKDEGQWAEADYGEIPTFAAAGNGGVWSSVEELARYELALQHHVFLSPATLQDSRTIKTFANWTSSEPPAVGWSWFIGSLPEPDHLLKIGHTGSQGGFAANYLTLPSKDLMLVFLMNTPRDFDAITHTILDELRNASWLD